MAHLSTRSLAAGTVLLAWGAGIALFTKKEMGRSVAERLSEMSLRVAPGARYFAVELGGRHVGFSSSTIDTLARTLQLTEYRVTEPLHDGEPRATAQSVVRLTRGLALREFTILSSTSIGPRRLDGRMQDDTTLAYVLRSTGAPGDTVRVRVAPGTIVPALMPLVVALGTTNKVVGTRQALPIFDPASLSARVATVTIAAESSFVLPDSAVYDATRAKWTVARFDTVRAWRLQSDMPRTDVWVDELGKPVRWVDDDGRAYQRTAYELAFENWRLMRPANRGDATVPHAEHGPSLLAAGVVPDSGGSPRRRFVLGGIPLAVFDLTGFGQTRQHDTITVERAPGPKLMPSFPVPLGGDLRQRYASDLASAPLVETDAPAIQLIARRICGGVGDPAEATRRIIAWMRDSLTLSAVPGPPSALQLLHDRHGDVIAHAALFTALARAAGLPARSTVGLLAVGDTAYPHAWAEVFLQGWVPVDPSFAQFPATSAHVRFLVDALGAFDDFQRAIAPLHVHPLAPEAGSTHD